MRAEHRPASGCRRQRDRDGADRACRRLLQIGFLWVLSVGGSASLSIAADTPLGTQQGSAATVEDAAGATVPTDSLPAAAGEAESMPDNAGASAAEEDQAAREPAGVDREAVVPVLWRPLVASAVGVTVVLLLMIGLKLHAFLALILGALCISLFVPVDVIGFAKSPTPHVLLDAGGGEPANIVSRVASSFGSAVTSIGILIAMAAIIGKCMLVSGAADRIVRAALDVFGEKRAALAMMVSGFILSVPVFFDTVFYLLVPLARTLYRQTRKNYLLYLAAIAAGGAITHTLVPPTPGPLLVTSTLGVDIGMVILIGLMVGAPSALVGLLAAGILNRRMPIEMRPMSSAASQVEEETPLERLPSLSLALVPVLLPVVLITIATVYGVVWERMRHGPSDAAVTAATEADAPPAAVGAQVAQDDEPFGDRLRSWLDLIGNPNLAMLAAALFSMYLCISVQGCSFRELADYVEEALLSGGVIILITAAGGAFGALLAMTEIQNVVESLFAKTQQGGLMLILVAYSLAAMIKVAQGSSTVSMIITSSLVASLAVPLADKGQLGYHLAYLVPVIGSGSLMGSWMNDSGFWVFAKMGVLTEGETLRSWTVLLAILSLSGLLVTLLFAWLIPLV